MAEEAIRVFVVGGGCGQEEPARARDHYASEISDRKHRSGKDW